MSTPPNPAKRSYESPRRRAMQADTRLVVIAAATKLFTERGWATSVRDIAREAGVAVETVYNAVGSKRELLKVALDVGLVGDDEPVALAERHEFTALGEGDRRARLSSAARMMADQYARVAALHHALDLGADADPELAELQRHVHQQQRETFARGMELVTGTSLEPAVVDGLQAVGSPAVYLQLVRLSGWSSAQYEEWLAQTLWQLITPIPEEPS